ncbi:MAG: cytidine/deoxycytidylate deaminase family protein [Candidatus Paceibacterota bacterium]
MAYKSKKKKVINKKAVKSEVEKTEVYKRPSWDEYFMSIVDVVGTRSTCDRGRSGSVLVKDKRIISTGYVGAPIGCKHCDEDGHEMHTVISDDGVKSRHCIRTVHTELNAITQAARFGISTDGATLYCKMVPCYTCAKSIINAGIKRVVAKEDYHASEQSKKRFKESGVKLELLNNKMTEYSDM